MTDSSEIVAAAQVRIMSIPVFGASIAYVISGPLFHSSSRRDDWKALRQALRALRNEYVGRRRISLRVNPLFPREYERDCLSVFHDEGYSYVTPAEAKHTIIIDVSPPLVELRRGLEQKWRNQLNQAERNRRLEILEGSDDQTFEMFLRMYRQMLVRKGLPEPGDIRTFRAMQPLLPDRLKMNVILVLEAGAPSAGVVCSAIGRRGIYLFGATADAGMRNKASYLAQWRVLQWIKEKGCTEYDLHGTNATANPGVYRFKTGLCGKNGKEVELMGHFDSHPGTLGKTVLSVATAANRLRRSANRVYERYRGFQRMN